MNKAQPPHAATVKKIAVVLIAAGLVGVLGWLGLWYHLGSDSARRYASCIQSGTQIFFDEGYFGNQLYAAKVTAFASGRQIFFGGQKYLRGSTLPDTNETNQYPVAAATAIPFKRGTHYGSTSNEVYQSKNTPALILRPGTGGFAEQQGLPVRTMTANLSPYAGDNFRRKQASQVHVHTGQSATLRGSTACLTIAPDQAQAFFESEIGDTGTVHIRR